ncbi:MAG: RIP metalloprotease RseP [Prevotella sp.]|nr:RIP metalloprotease RseP [Prevotella sp.]
MEVFLIRVLQFVLALSLLILLHEGGHFFFAKLFGVRVSRFYLFFNPKFHLLSTYDTWLRRLLGLKPTVVPKDKDGKKEYVGTEYGIGWLPLGGYCAIDGMIDETNQKLSEETHPWEFRVKPAWQRLLIMVGGVLVNFLLALFIYSMILFYWGDSYIPVKNMSYGMKFNQEAKSYGFRDGDILLATDIAPFKEFGADMYRNISEAHRVDVLRGGQTVSISLPGDLNLLDMIKSEPRFVTPFIPAVVDSVLPGTPAAGIGLQKGDRLLAINGNEVDSYNEFTDQIARLGDIISTAKTSADSMRVRQATVVYQRGESTDTASIVLTADLKLGFVPLMLANIYEPVTIEYGFLESIPAGIKFGWSVLASYVDDMKYVFTAEGAKSLGGFGAIGSLFPPMWDWYMFWKMTAFLSIILAFMNILPIPALDGGHVLFLLYEMITRRKPSDEFMIKAEYVGFGLLVLLMVYANLNDILRWLGYM